MNVPKLRFKEFNDEWTKYKLNDFLDLLTDYDANGSFADMANNVKTYDTQNYAWYVRATDLENNSPLDKVKYTDKESYDFLKKTALYGDEVLMAKRGNIGNVYYFKSKTKYATLGPNCYLLKANNKIDNYFLYSYFKSTNGYKKLNRLNASSTLGALYKDDVKNINLIFPEKKEQSKISRTLEVLDKKIELQSKKIEDLKLFKKGLDIKIFNNKKLFDVGIIKEYFESDGGTALEKYIDEKGTYNIISIGNYTPDGRYYDNGQKVIYNEKTKMKLLSKNNLAMILNDKTTTGDIIGSTILIDEDNKYIYNQRTQKLICKKINAEYSWCFFNSKYFRDKVFRLSQGGTQIYVNYSQIENQKIFIPKNKKIENDIVKSIFLITKLIDNENDKFLKLQKLKKGLMQNMFV